VYWLQSPPYVRRAGAVLLILAALAWDIRAAATEPFPTAAHPIAAGSRITDDAIAWIELPQGRLPIPDLVDATAARDIGSGEPLTPSLLVGLVTAPTDWWTVPIEIGALAAPGDEVMLVIAEPPLTTIGLVITAQTGDPFTLDYRPAAVAVPPVVAPVIAAAEREGLLITAVRPDSSDR